MLVLAIFASSLLADEAPLKPTPKPPKSIDTMLSVRINRDAKEAKLIIPRSQLKQLRAELDEMDDSDDANASLGFTRSQTIASGMLFSLAFLFGGVWFARSGKIRSASGKALAIGSVLFLSGGIATIVLGNAGPPPDARHLTGKFFSPAVNSYKYGSGKIKLEVSNVARNPELIVPDPPDPQETPKPNGEE